MNNKMSDIKLAQKLLQARDAQQEELERNSHRICMKDAMDLREGDYLRDRRTATWLPIKGISLYSSSRPDYESSVDWVYVDGAAYKVAALKRRFYADGRRFMVMVNDDVISSTPASF